MLFINYPGMYFYDIRTAAELTEQEIAILLQYWNVEEWRNMTACTFRQRFMRSLFYLLSIGDTGLCCAARINFDFSIALPGRERSIAEMVGLVSLEKGTGHGRELLQRIYDTVNGQRIEVLGFCEKALRPFYEKSGIPVLYDKAKCLREKNNNNWVIPDDDDILNLSLSPVSLQLIENLSMEQPGYILC